MISYLEVLSLFHISVIGLVTTSIILTFSYTALRILRSTYGSRGENTRSQVVMALVDLERCADLVKRYFMATRAELRVLFWSCASLLFIAEVMVIPSLESLPRWGAFVGLISKLAGAYVTGFIFYFVVAHWQRQRDKEVLQDHIGPLAQGLLDNARQMMWPMLHDTRYDVDPELDVLSMERVELSNMLERFDENPAVHALVEGENASVNDVVLYHVNESKRLMSELFVHYPMLDVELVKILNELSFSDLHRMGDLPIKGCKPSWLSENIWTYFKRLRPLERYLAQYPGKRAWGPTDEERWAREHELHRAMGFDITELGIAPDPDLHWKTWKMLRRQRQNRKHKTS